MEGFCRGCLVKQDEPIDLIPYSEKNRRLFIYSTGLQVKRNDTFTFQLCKECYLNMKQSCTFKKQCRNSEKKLKNYMSLKEDGDAVDFCSYLQNCEDLLTIRLPLASGNSTPAHPRNKDDDNESTCTSIRNFMSDILQGEEVPDTEARIIRELIEEEADVLDDSLDSHWLQDDMSIATEFRMDFSFSPFSTPRSVQNDHCYTPKRLNDEKDAYFTNKQIEKPPDEQYHMPILDDCEIDINQPANIPMYEIKPYCYTQQSSKSPNSDINNLRFTNIQCDSYNGMENQNYEVNNVKQNEKESQNYEMNHLKLNKTENQNYEIDNPVKINVNSENEQEIYFVEQITAIKSDKIEDDFLNIGEKTQDFISATEIENDFYNITINSNQSKVEKKMDETSLLNDELEHYINKAELKKKNNVVDNKCLIDRNLEKALQNEDNKEISLDILIASPKVDLRSGASTPTIRNILFGDALDSNDSPKLGQCIEKYQPIEGQTNILDDFLTDEDSNNVGKVRIKDEILSDFSLNNKVEILDIKIIKEKDAENQGIDIIKNDLVTKKEKSEDIRDLIDDYVTNIYDKINIAEKNIDDEEIDALELLKATNKTIDDNIFKRPLTPMYDKYDLENSECKICNKNFKTQINLKIHFAKKHKFKIVTNVPKKDSLREEVCDICGEITKGKAELTRHKKKVHQFQKEFPCTECFLQFPTQHGLNIHRRSHKENLVKSTSKVYAQICNICGKRVSTANYKLHLLRHLKDFKFKCEICDKGFYRQGDYELHLGTHTNTRPFKCKICPKSYKRRASLKIHNKRHLEKQEFICNICSSRFTSKRMLKHHFGTKLCNPDNNMSKDQPANKALMEQYKPANRASEEQCMPANGASENQCKPVNNISTEQCNPDNKTLEQCKPANTTSAEQCMPTNGTLLEKQCKPDNNTSMQQCNPANKTSEEQCKPSNRPSEKQCMPANGTMEKQCKPDNKTSEITDETKNTEEVITEEIEFTVKFSPMSVNDELSDTLLD